MNKDKENELNKENEFNGNDFIYHKDISNNYSAGGYNVKSLLLKYGFSPIKTVNDYNFDISKSQNVSDIFSNLVIPNWIYRAPKFDIDFDIDFDKENIDKNGGKKTKNNTNQNINNNKNYHYDDDDDVISIEPIEEDLHNKLLELVKHYNPKDITYKNNKTKKNIKNNKKRNTKKR